MDKSRALLLLHGLFSAIGAYPNTILAAESPDGDIVVTARRLEERTSDVPLHVDAIRADDIGAGNVDGLQSLSSRIPGLSFEAIWGGANSFPTLRGQNQPSVAGDAVGMFVDEVYQANRDALDIEPLDLDRIEVVRGPQSALFGHSSFAGLIRYVPALPQEDLLASASVDAGTDKLRGLKIAASGPVSGTLKGRMAASWRTADGTWEDATAPGAHLGNYRKFAFSGAIATRDGSGPLSARLAGRYGESRTNQPPFFALDFKTYNCGSRDAASGAWSYYCGAAPRSARISLSPGIPDSRTLGGQIALHLILDLDDAELRSDSSFYNAVATSFRDFDGSTGGDLFGVCLVGLNCTAPFTQSIPVIRLQAANIVQRRRLSAREFAQEFRLGTRGKRRFAWQLGATVYWTRTQTTVAVGAERGALTSGERLTSLIYTNPQRVGTIAAVNSALVDDPNSAQIVQSDAVEKRRTFAAFATADLAVLPKLRLRGEVRASWERLALDSRKASFTTSFGTSLGARDFFDLSPRISIEHRPAKNWLVFASHARGSRSGGINGQPNLLAQEQTFDPENNWTSEFGVKYTSRGALRTFELTAYRIDWSNAQILGFSTTPGVNALITRNTKGIETWGIEAAAQFQLRPWLGIEVAGSYAHPRFKEGSEDPGSNAFCGLSSSSVTSNLCTIRPSLINPTQLVPDISGKIPSRAAELSWAAALLFTPQAGPLQGLRLRVDATHQDNVFDRQINGLYYGAHTLIGCRLAIPIGRIFLELWGTNMTNADYVRVAASRPPLFYSGQPRPTDLLLAEGRRLGLTLRYGS